MSRAKVAERVRSRDREARSIETPQSRLGRTAKLGIAARHYVGTQPEAEAENVGSRRQCQGIALLEGRGPTEAPAGADLLHDVIAAVQKLLTLSDGQVHRVAQHQALAGVEAGERLFRTQIVRVTRAIRLCRT
jgi:hypothetical protein